MGALPQEKRWFTYADYKGWELKEGERWEIIYGEAYAMSAPNTRHQAVLGGLFYQFYNFLRGKPCKVYPAPFDVRLFYAEDESDDTVVQPDIVVICDEKKRGTEGCRGAPDLVVEILSPSNTAIEMERKRRLYQEAGVREYWLVDPGGKLDTNGSQEKIPESKSLTVYRFQDGEILTAAYKSTDTAPVTILPGLLIPLGEVFAE